MIIAMSERRYAMQSFKFFVALTSFVFIALLVTIMYKPALADQAKQTDTKIKKVEPKETIRINPNSKSKMKVRKPSNPIKVTYPHRGDTFRRGRSTRVIWEYEDRNQEPRTNFRVKILKNSDRSWSVDLGTNHNNWIESLAYQRYWAIPEGFTAGDDYFFRIIHVPSGATSHSKLFTIIE
jgi:hypothetical protein